MAKEDYLFTLSNGKLSEAQVNALNKSDYLFSINKHFTPEEKVPFTGWDTLNPSSVSFLQKNTSNPEINTALRQIQNSSKAQTTLPWQQTTIKNYGINMQYADSTFKPTVITPKDVVNFGKSVPKGIQDFGVSIVKNAGTNIQYNIQKSLEFWQNPSEYYKTIGDVQATFDSINKEWNDYLAKRKEMVAFKALEPVQEKIRASVDWEDKASQYGFMFGQAASQSVFAGATGGLGVTTLFASSLDNTIAQMESEGVDMTSTEAMLRAFGTSAVEVGSEYAFNVLAKFGATGAAVASRSAIGRAALSKATGVFDNIAIKSTSLFNEFLAKLPSPKMATMARFTAFLAQKGNEEGMEEVISYIGSGIIQLWTTDKDKKFSDVVSLKDAVSSYVVGGLMGFVVSGINGIPALRKSMPNASKWIDSNKDRPYSDITFDEWNEFGEIVVEDAKQPDAKAVNESVVNEGAVVAEYANAKADTEYAEEIAKADERVPTQEEVATQEQVVTQKAEPQKIVEVKPRKAITTEQAIAKLRAKALTDDDAEAWLESTDGAEIKALAQNEQALYDKVTELTAQIDSLAGTRDENGVMIVNLQLLAAKKAIDKLQNKLDKGPKEGYALSTHIEKILTMIDAVAQGDEERAITLRNEINSPEVFHKIFHFEDAVAKVNQKMGKNIASPSKAKRKHETYRMELVEKFYDKTYEQTPEDVVAVNAYLQEGMEQVKKDGKAPPWFGQMSAIALKNATKAGQQLYAYSVIAKKLKGFEAQRIIDSLKNDLFNTPKNKRTEVQGKEIADTLGKTRGKIITDEFTDFQNAINSVEPEPFVEPEGLPTELEGIIGDFEDVVGESIEKEPTMEETLAKKIRKDFNKVAKTPKEKTKADKIIDYLFKAYKDVVPNTKEKKAPKADEERFAFIAQIMMDKTVYDEVWSKAKDIVGEFAEGDETFEPFFAKFDSLYRTQLVKSAVRMNLKSMGISLNKIAKEYYLGNRNATVSGFMDSLRANLKKSVGDQMSTYDFNFLFDQVYKELSAQIETKKEAIMKAEAERLKRLQEKAEKSTMQYRLSRMMRNDFNKLPPKQKDQATKILRQLFARYSEIMHAEEITTVKDPAKILAEKKAKAQTTADELFNFVGTLAMDSANLQTVWNEALDMMAEFGESSDDLKKVFEVINPLYNQKLVGKTMMATLKSMNLNLKDMAFQHFFRHEASLAEFSLKLRNNIETALGKEISDVEFDYLDGYIRDRLEKAIEIKRFHMEAALIDRIKKFKDAGSREQQKSYQEKMVKQMMDTAMIDGFSNETVVEMWQEHLGVSTLTAAMQQDIYQTMENIANLRASGADEFMITQEYEQLLSRIAQQAKSTTMEKWKAWRGVSMLLQPRNLLRNPASNIAMIPSYGTADIIQHGVEKWAMKLPENERSSGQFFLDINGDSDAAIEARSITIEEIVAGMTQSSKFETLTRIASKKTIFSTKALESARVMLTETMTGTHKNVILRSLGDTPVFQMHFRKSYARKLSALGFSLTMDDGAKENIIAQAKAYAVDIATERTFRRLNVVSKQLLNLRKSGFIPEVTVSAITPFIVTTTAIGKEVWDFSTLSLIVNTARSAKMFADIQSGKDVSVESRVSLAKVTSKAWAGFATQTVVGFILGSLGYMTGGWPDDKKEREMWKMMGKQPYSIYVPGVGSVSINWLQPFASNLIFGAEVAHSGWDISRISDAMVYQLFTPTIAETLKDTFDTGYQSEFTSKWAMSIIANFGLQHVPVLLQQIADASDPYERDIYQGTAWEILANRLLQRTPIASQKIQVKTDIWGQPVKKADFGMGAVGNILAALAPFKVSVDKMDATTQAVMDVYKASGDATALPSAVERTFTVNKKPITLTDDEYLEYTALVGQKRKSMIDTAIKNDYWNEMSPELKAKTLSKIYGQGQTAAKNEIMSKYYSTLPQ